MKWVGCSPERVGNVVRNTRADDCLPGFEVVGEDQVVLYVVRIALLYRFRDRMCGRLQRGNPGVCPNPLLRGYRVVDDLFRGIEGLHLGRRQCIGLVGSQVDRGVELAFERRQRLLVLETRVERRLERLQRLIESLQLGIEGCHRCADLFDSRTGRPARPLFVRQLGQRLLDFGCCLGAETLDGLAQLRELIVAPGRAFDEVGGELRQCLQLREFGRLRRPEVDGSGALVDLGFQRRAGLLQRRLGAGRADLLDVRFSRADEWRHRPLDPLGNRLHRARLLEKVLGTGLGSDEGFLRGLGVGQLVGGRKGGASLGSVACNKRVEGLVVDRGDNGLYLLEDRLEFRSGGIATSAFLGEDLRLRGRNLARY